MTNKLQEGRAAMAVRCQEIAERELPAGWVIKYRKSLTGYCHPKLKQIDTPEPKTRKSLYIFLHEVGHARLHSDGKRKLRYIEEYEAEIFAHNKMREHGLAVPAAMTERARKYVARKIHQAQIGRASCRERV